MVAVQDEMEMRLPLIHGWDDLPFRVHLRRPLDPDELFGLCQANRKLRIEQTAEGELIIMPPTGGQTGRRNANLTMLRNLWATRAGTVLVFDSITVSIRPTGAGRSPDASWIRRSRWAKLSARDQERFPPLCPDFVAEIRSRTDSLTELQAKMDDYLANGARLGWLLDPGPRQVWIYEQKRKVVHLDHPKALSGGTVLPRLRLKLADIW